MLENPYISTSTLSRIPLTNAFESRHDFLYTLYRSLTSHPWTIIIPLMLAAVFAFFAWKLSFQILKKVKPIRNNHFFYQYILSNVVFVLVSAIFSLLLTLLIQYFSPFWMIGFIFYGPQVVLPLFLIITAALSLFPSGQIAPAVVSFKGLSTFLKWIGTIIASAILAVSFYSFFIEPFNTEVTNHHFVFPNQPSLHLKIVHLTDIQTDYLGARERDVVQKVREIKPDVIVITGDYFNGCKQTHPLAFASARYVLENLEAPFGIYAVSSDSNCYADHEALFAGLPIDYLENESKKITINNQDLYVVGLSRRQPDDNKAWAHVPANSNKLLIYHGPEVFFNEAEMSHNPDLILVGHTHGGQIALPFIGPLTSATEYGRKFAQGWFEKEGTKMYVNRGVGMEGSWAPKIRFLVRPEIAVVEVGE